VGVDTLVVLMGVGERHDIATELIRAGREATTPCAFVERGSTPQERIVLTTLEAVASGVVEVQSPAVWVIGAVVNVRGSLVNENR
jgi:uroporphyrin-III C-methyltransferase